MSAQRIIGIGIAVTLATLTAWQATGSNWLTAAVAGLGCLAGFFPAVHKGES